MIIAIETQAHFSGNSRYLVLGDALVDVCGAVGFGWLAIVLAAAGVRLVRRASASAAVGFMIGACALVAAIFVFAPNFIGNKLISLPATHGSLNYQAQLRTGMQKLIAPVRWPQAGAGLRPRDDRGLPGSDGRLLPQHAHGVHRSARPRPAIHPARRRT